MISITKERSAADLNCNEVNLILIINFDTYYCIIIEHIIEFRNNTQKEDTKHRISTQRGHEIMKVSIKRCRIIENIT